VFSDIILHDLWEITKTGLYAGLYLLVAYIAIKISHNSIQEFFGGVLSGLRGFIRRDPSARSLNMLFGILILLFIVLVLAAVEIAEAQHHEPPVPFAIFALVGLFFLTVFFSLSIAFCAKAER
jgi:hypothetical protein